MDIIETNKRIEELRKLKREKETLDGQIASLKVKLDKEKSEFFKAQREYTKESNDVESLENNKIKGAIFSILGKKDDKMYQERREMEIAGEKLQKEEEEYKEAKNNYDSLCKRRREYNDIDEEFEFLLKSKEEYIIQKCEKEAGKIAALKKEIDSIAIAVDGNFELISIGEKVLEELDSMAYYLGGARRFAVTDRFIGSSLITELSEHRNYSNARRYMESAKEGINRLLDMTERYKNPLSYISLQIDVNEFDTAIDIFVDSRSHDREMVRKATSALTRTESAIEIVNEFINSRRIISEEKVMEIQNIKREIDTIVEKYGLDI